MPVWHLWGPCETKRQTWHNSQKEKNTLSFQFNIDRAYWPVILSQKNQQQKTHAVFGYMNASMAPRGPEGLNFTTFQRNGLQFERCTF